MILMRGIILDENVKKGVGGLYLLYFTLLTPSLLSPLDLRRRRKK